MSRLFAPGRRRFLGFAANAGLFAILAATFAGRAFAIDKKTGDGSISMMRGQVFVNGKQANPQTAIPSNSEVRTGKRSMVAFAAGGDAHVLKSNTTITLSSSGGFTDQLRLLTGTLLSAWGQRPPGKAALLSTKTATIGIRGTVTYAADGKFSVIEGSVEYGYTDQSGQRHVLVLSRDSSGKIVSVDESGTRIDWVPPITREEVQALIQAVTAGTGSGDSNVNSGTVNAIESLGEDAQSIIDELQRRTEAGELTGEAPPGGSGGSSSPESHY